MFGTCAWAGYRTGGLNTGFRSLGIIGRAIGCVTIVTSADGRHRLKVQMKGGTGISRIDTRPALIAWKQIGQLGLDSGTGI